MIEGDEYVVHLPNRDGVPYLMRVPKKPSSQRQLRKGNVG